MEQNVVDDQQQDGGDQNTGGRRGGRGRFAGGFRPRRGRGYRGRGRGMSRKFADGQFEGEQNNGDGGAAPVETSNGEAPNQ